MSIEKLGLEHTIATKKSEIPLRPVLLPLTTTHHLSFNKSNLIRIELVFQRKYLIGCEDEYSSGISLEGSASIVGVSGNQGRRFHP